MSQSAVKDKNILKKLDLFFGQFKLLKLKAGGIITKPNDSLDSIFYIKKGQMRIYSISKDGEEVTLHIARSGSYFPMMLVLGQAKINYYSEALTKVELFKAPSQDVVNFVKGDQEVLFDLTKRFAAGICGLMMRVESLASNTADDKLASLIPYFIKHYGHELNEGIAINMPLTHSMIGSWIGLNRETVTREIKQSNSIKYEKRHLIILKSTDTV